MRMNSRMLMGRADLALPPAPEITTEALDAATEGEAYSFTLQATGSGITWTLESGTLPNGLALHPVSGEIAGTPTEAGTFGSLVFRATNAGGYDEVTLSLEVAASFDMEAWLETAYGYWDAEDNATLAMSGDDLVSCASKGTGGALLAKITSGSAQLGTLGGVQAFQNLSALFTLTVRDAGDTADVNMSTIAPLAASCFVFVVGRVDGVNSVLASDASLWISHNIGAAGAASATYWPAGSVTVTWGSNISHTDPHVIAVKHGGGNLSISVDGGTFVDAACGDVGGTSAARIIAGLRGRVSKMAVWQVRDPADFDAGIAALKTYFGIS